MPVTRFDDPRTDSRRRDPELVPAFDLRRLALSPDTVSQFLALRVREALGAEARADAVDLHVGKLRGEPESFVTAYLTAIRRDAAGECAEKGMHEGESLAKSEKGRAAEKARTPEEHRAAASYHAAENAKHEKAGNKKAAAEHESAVDAHLQAIEKGSAAASVRAGVASDRAHLAASNAHVKVDSSEDRDAAERAFNLACRRARIAAGAGVDTARADAAAAAQRDLKRLEGAWMNPTIGARSDAAVKVIPPEEHTAPVSKEQVVALTPAEPPEATRHRLAELENAWRKPTVGSTAESLGG